MPNQYNTRGLDWINKHLDYQGDDCLIWPYGRIGNGYGQFKLKGKGLSAHRYICEQIHGPPPTPLHQAAHSCGNGQLGCVNQKHIFWKTPIENMADKLVHGTHSRGERSVRAKLSENDVRSMRHRLDAGEPIQNLADEFNVSYQLVSKIRARKRWQHLRD